MSLAQRGFQLRKERGFQALVGPLLGFVQQREGPAQGRGCFSALAARTTDKGCGQASSYFSPTVFPIPAILQPCQGVALLQDCHQPSGLTHLPNQGTGPGAFHELRLSHSPGPGGHGSRSESAECRGRVSDQRLQSEEVRS